ncbi:unnamed protein product [Symbiodinium sp. CCMP2592]|nr:unnamed protein product [Symbiodinium sp. CCMP2592]
MAIRKRAALHPCSARLFLSIVGIALLTSSSAFSGLFGRRGSFHGLLRRSGSRSGMLEPMNAGRDEEAIRSEQAIRSERDIDCPKAVSSFQFDPRLCNLLQNWRDVWPVTVTKLKKGLGGAEVRTEDGLIGFIHSKDLGSIGSVQTGKKKKKQKKKKKKNKQETQEEDKAIRCGKGPTKAAVIIKKVRPRFWQVADPQESIEGEEPIVFEVVDSRMVFKPEHDAVLEKLQQELEEDDAGGTHQVEVTMVRDEIVYVLTKDGLLGWVPLSSLGLRSDVPSVGDELNVTVVGIRSSKDAEWTFFPPRAQSLISSFTGEDPKLFGRPSLCCAGPQMQELLTQLRDWNVVLAEIVGIKNKGVSVEIAGAEFFLGDTQLTGNRSMLKASGGPKAVFSVGEQVKMLCEWDDQSELRLSIRRLERRAGAVLISKQRVFEEAEETAEMLRMKMWGDSEPRIPNTTQVSGNTEDLHKQYSQLIQEYMTTSEIAGL